MCHLCKESVNINWFGLAEAIDTEYRLNIVSRIPARIEHNNAIRCDQINAQRPCSCGDEE